MRLFRPLLLALLSISMSSATVAQSDRIPRVPIGSRLPVWEEVPSANQREGVRVLYDFASCVVKKKRREAEAVLAALPESREQRVALASLLGEQSLCLRDASRMEVKASIFRGALAEALYRSTVPESPPLEPRPMGLDFASLAARLTSADVSGVDDEDRALLTARWMAYCAVHENPLGVDAVLRTKLGKEAETLAIRELRPTLSGCLFKGHQAVISRLPLRAILAEALYDYYLRSSEVVQ